MALNYFDSMYISRDSVHKVIDQLTEVKNYLKNFGKPLDSIIKDIESLKGVLKILGFFRIPGSADVLNKVSMIQEYARVVVRDMYKINLDKSISELYELYLKSDSLVAYVKKIEKENEDLKRKLNKA